VITSQIPPPTSLAKYRRLVLHIFGRLFMLGSVGLLIVCAGICALWARSYRTSDSWRVTRSDNHHSIAFVTGRGFFLLCRFSDYPVSSNQYDLARHLTTTPAFSLDPHRPLRGGIFNFVYSFPSWVGSGPRDEFLFRASSLAAESGALAALCLGTHTIVLVTRRRRFQKGCCRICGYDLCESPDRCPECGTKRQDHPSRIE